MKSDLLEQLSHSDRKILYGLLPVRMAEKGDSMIRGRLASTLPKLAAWWKQAQGLLERPGGEAELRQKHDERQKKLRQVEQRLQERRRVGRILKGRDAPIQQLVEDRKVQDLREQRDALEMRLGVHEQLLKSWNRSADASMPGFMHEATSGPVIRGTSAPRYARKALEVLEEHQHISTFSRLKAKMGGAPVDTLKRTNATAYDDLPREEKSFERFKELLFSAEIT